MNSCCTTYHIDPIELGQPIDLDSQECSSCTCHCGYIQFETLAPHIKQLTTGITQDDDYIELEIKLRQQIIETSRLFDVLTKAEPGTYSKSHFKIIKLYGDGTKYLKIPKFIKNTLELYTSNGYLINPKSYYYKDGYLIFGGCDTNHSSCACTTTCGSYTSRKIPSGWTGCLQAKAKFGNDCADDAVKMAVRDYLIEHNLFANAKDTIFNGFPVSRKFRVPDSWSSLIQEYSQDVNFYNRFGFA